MIERKVLSIPEKAEIVNLANAGLCIADISKETGISRYKVGRLIYEAFGITDNGKPWTAEDIATIHRCAAAGEPIHQVARRLHRTINAVRKCASTLGVHLRWPGTRPGNQDILSPNSAKRNYEEVKHKLDRLALENVKVRPGRLLRITPPSPDARVSSSICAESFFPGSAQAKTGRGA